MSSKRECPICHKETANFLKHLRFTHEITDSEDCKQKMEQIKELDIKKEKFGKYVEETLEKMKKGEISAEEYRELITKWNNDHS